MQAEKSDLLQNYRQLVERVDHWCREIENLYAQEMTCSRGCDSCC